MSERHHQILPKIMDKKNGLDFGHVNCDQDQEAKFKLE